MNGLRVVSVIHPFRPAFSGEGEWWLRMIPRLRARGIEVDILTRANGDSAPETEVVEGAAVQRIRPDAERPYRSWMIGVIRALARRRGQFDVALFHSPNCDAVYASCFAGRVLGWKTVYKMTLLRSDDLQAVRESGRFGLARLAALRLADGYISMSGALTRGFENARFLQNKLLVVPQGVDTGKFRPVDWGQKPSVRRRLGIPEAARVALFCGAIIHRKGVDVLVEAWRRVRDRLGDAVLLMVGPNHRSGLEEPENCRFSEGIERRIRELDLQESIKLFGYQKDMQPFYTAADIFVFPSRSEGWNSVISEAMACGLPCIVSYLDGISEEHLTDGEHGVILRSPDHAAYAEQMVRLLTDGNAVRQMGRRARARAIERFDVERTADHYASFLAAIAEPGFRRRPAPAGLAVDSGSFELTGKAVERG